MLTPVTVLSTLEAYYDAAPRPLATTEEVGPFTLFVRTSTDGWPYYARPALGYEGPCTAAQVTAVRERQRELGVPESLEWVHETTPTLLSAAREAGLHVEECPLLVLPGGADAVTAPLPAEYSLAMLTADSTDLQEVMGAVDAGFSGSDDVTPRPEGPVRELLRSGLLATAGAYDARGAVAGGSHSPRGSATELQGIAVLPRARRQGVGAALTAFLVDDARARGIDTVFLSAGGDAVARVYERIGFRRVGTACVAGAPQRSDS
jgi:ribosomal protein S18 acetylase RimI-like enzyme